MLLRFVAENFLSIAEPIEFDMFPYTRLREKKDHIYGTPQVDLLKTAAIFGANGSGKSNLVKAMAFVREFVVNGDLFKTSTSIGPFRLDIETLQKPCRFEIEFLHAGTYFSYSLRASRLEVEEESLSIIQPVKDERLVLFSRKRSNGEEKIVVDQRYEVDEKDKARVEIYARELLKPGNSLLHVFSLNESFAEMNSAQDWFKNGLMVIQPELQFMNLAEIIYRNPDFKAYSLNVLRTLDTGVVDIDLHRSSYDEFFGQDDLAKKQEVMAALAQGHDYVKLNVYGEELLVRMEDEEAFVYRAVLYHATEAGVPIMFALREESDGTRRVLDFLPVWLTLKELPATIVVDEIGRSLHPNLLEHLIRLFMTSETKGQLIFTTHEDNLLSQDVFRRDELWMIQKTSKGSSEMYPLSDFKSRNDTDLRKNYLFGRFGGTPRLKHYFSQEQRVAAGE